MSFRDRHPGAHAGITNGGPAPDKSARMRRRARHAWTMRLLRAAPVIAALSWLAFFVVRFGPSGRGSPIGKALLITVGISVAFAFASGAYEQTRVTAWLRRRLQRRRVDWEAFDAMRAKWEERRRD